MFENQNASMNELLVVISHKPMTVDNILHFVFRASDSCTKKCGVKCKLMG